MPVEKKDHKPAPPEFSNNPPDDTSNDVETVSTGRKVAPSDLVTQERPKHEDKAEVIPQSYVHLANGEVLRVKNEDLPGGAGAFNPFGHWQKDGKVYQVIGVYDVEEEAGE